MRNYLVILFTFLFGIIYSQNSEINLKVQGLKYLSIAGKTDSALVFLHDYNKLSPKDGEVIGAIALGYYQKGDYKQSLKWAKKNVKKQEQSSADGWIAGALSYHALKDSKNSEKWLEKGIKQHPSDYLLRYHFAKILFPKDRQKAEIELLNSIYLEPSFAEAHLLLGEQMYQNGENLKALLPVAYFLVLYHDSYQSPDLVAVIENIFTEWSKIGKKNKMITKDNSLSINYKPQQKADVQEKYEWIATEFVKLLKAMEDEKFIESNPSWAFYLDFFSNISKQNYANPLIRHILYSRYQGETLEWLTVNRKQYNEMIDWIAIWGR